MESPPVSHSGNWLSEESWGGPFLSKMSCSIINLLLGNYLQKGGRYQQRNCRREATIGILCTRAGGVGVEATPCFHAGVVTCRFWLLLSAHQGVLFSHLARCYQWAAPLEVQEKLLCTSCYRLGCSFWLLLRMRKSFARSQAAWICASVLISKY